MKVVVSELKIIRSTRKAKNTNEIDGTESKVESFGARSNRVFAAPISFLFWFIIWSWVLDSKTPPNSSSRVAIARSQNLVHAKVNPESPLMRPWWGLELDATDCASKRRPETTVGGFLEANRYHPSFCKLYYWRSTIRWTSA